MECCITSCPDDAQYQENQYTELCIQHWYKVAKGLYLDWRENDFKGTIWIFHRDKVIKN